MSCLLPWFPQAPVFLLFLDCVWQLLSQFPSHFQLTGDFLLALHDSIQLPLFTSFMANCQRERCKRSQVRAFPFLNQTHTVFSTWQGLAAVLVCVRKESAVTLLVLISC